MITPEELAKEILDFVNNSPRVWDDDGGARLSHELAQALLAKYDVAERDACRLCGASAEAVINIDFKPVRICNICCLRVTKQEVANWRVSPDQQLPLTNSELCELLATNQQANT